PKSARAKTRTGLYCSATISSSPAATSSASPAVRFPGKWRSSKRAETARGSSRCSRCSAARSSSSCPWTPSRPRPDSIRNAKRARGHQSGGRGIAFVQSRPEAVESRDVWKLAFEERLQKIQSDRRFLSSRPRFMARDHAVQQHAATDDAQNFGSITAADFVFHFLKRKGIEKEINRPLQPRQLPGGELIDMHRAIDWLRHDGRGRFHRPGIVDLQSLDRF